ncbi:PAS domain S-box [Sphaerochaeta pleomorpha str. Grapes]|uniref:PAS domain S-box n=1 Tax=Sphaerochaeta pleomorpha (strain ATCC BAA-1885 / DSM 22778 / Grapes) TaxID=158190 RepID=G8QS26_SPHPG|nr:SpoIIE family protein phosphatase [Sphaerochaeta pleomorpha]AEV30024.1 PAS domain S-box [Sphaerochaeta pleomorpha str. Grapes]
MTREEIDGISYRILLSIGDSLDLRKMLGKSLATYMEELCCTRGAVILIDKKESPMSPLSIAYSIPRNIEKNASFMQLMQNLLHYTIADDSITLSIDGDTGTYHLMSISSVGILILYTRYLPLDQKILQALRQLNHKLGTACEACLQNTKLQKSSQQFMEMANMLPGLIIELDQDYKVTFFNQRTQEIFKQIDSDDFHPQKIFDFFPKNEIEHVRQLLKFVESGEPLTSADIWMKNSRGQLFMVNLIISAIQYMGKVTGFRGIAVDISSRVKLEQDLTLRDKLLNSLALSTQELLKSKDFKQAIYHTFELFGNATNVDRICCYINCPDQEHNVKHVNRYSGWVSDRYLGESDISAPFTILGSAISNFMDILGSKKAVTAIISALKPGITRTLLEKEQIKSILMLPLFVKDTFYGFLSISDCTSERVWSDIEKDMYGLFSISISEAFERHQAENELQLLYQDIMEDLDTAQSIQNYILPPWFRLQKDLLFSSNYQPWAKIGGDLFDCIQLQENRYVIYIADISGHGVQAALTMTAVKSIFNMVIRSEQDLNSPSAVVTQLNGILSKRLFNNNYMTMCYCLVDLNAMTITSLNAGHPPLMVLNQKTSSITLLDKKGDIPLGWIEDHVYDESSVQILPFSYDDTVCLITDGVFECFNARNEQLGLSRFNEILKEEIQVSNCIMVPHDCFRIIDEEGYTTRNDDFTFVSFQALPQKEEQKPFYYELVSNLHAVDEASAACETYVLHSGGNELQAFKVRLIVSEFLSNIVQHGLEGKSNEIICLEISYGQEIIIIFRDNAIEWPLPLQEDSMDSFFDLLNNDSNTHGRGMQIIHSYTKEAVRRRAHSINETKFVLNYE